MPRNRTPAVPWLLYHQHNKGILLAPAPGHKLTAPESKVTPAERWALSKLCPEACLFLAAQKILFRRVRGRKVWSRKEVRRGDSYNLCLLAYSAYLRGDIAALVDRKKFVLLKMPNSLTFSRSDIAALVRTYTEPLCPHMRANCVSFQDRILNSALVRSTPASKYSDPELFAEADTYPTMRLGCRMKQCDTQVDIEKYQGGYIDTA
ncbi:hypothetical protein EK21DRAFT_90316 [Setomelanomma holmii]|uniref:Uncharacterized protein n=1 Tax=Setomelanomma holmii TaxID=210430 RepID=A0A9P4H764_9PLEO|nr:hypothetical protein EK21DRAFT_90316 [Setomelanomma holmii]